MFWCVLSDQNWPSFLPSMCFDVCCLIKIDLFHLLCVFGVCCLITIGLFHLLCVLMCVV